MARRIVWVLGAGFSRPLGGPLLADLFTEASAGNLQARFPREQYPALSDAGAELVRWLYRWGLGQEVISFATAQFKERGERLWENAEEYLEYLDTAAALGSESPGWRRLAPIVERYVTGKAVSHRHLREQLGGPNVRKHIADRARRLLAAECSAFLPLRGPVALALERWIPYHEWWRKLGPGHTIITFNYDLVIERLDAQEPRKLIVVPPGSKEPLPPDKVALLKLHGSLDWRCLPGSAVPDSFATNQGDEFALTCDDYELAIASPGLTKQRTVKNHFSSLWTHAENALSTADVVVFVGYRFPPTDSEALSRLLAAIGRNNSPFLALHTVLGPKKSDDVVRLHSLLRYAARASRREPIERMSLGDLEEAMRRGQRFYKLVPQALFSQDFLLVAQEHDLAQPYLVTWE